MTALQTPFEISLLSETGNFNQWVDRLLASNTSSLSGMLLVRCQLCGLQRADTGRHQNDLLNSKANTNSL